MEGWQAEMNQQRLGVVEAKDEDEAVDVAAKKFQIPDSERHKIMVRKAEPERNGYRDRGVRDCTPPTPPDIRVRIRRFAGLSTGDVSHRCRRVRSWRPSYRLPLRLREELP